MDPIINVGVFFVADSDVDIPLVPEEDEFVSIDLEESDTESFVYVQKEKEIENDDHVTIEFDALNDEELEALKAVSIETLTTLKTYDASLKIIRNVLKFGKFYEEHEIAKHAHLGLKYAGALHKVIPNFATNEELSFDLGELATDPISRRKVVSSYKAIHFIFSYTSEGILKLIDFSKNYYGGALFDRTEHFLKTILPITAVATPAFKMIGKVTALHAAYTEFIHADPADKDRLHIKKVALLKTSMACTSTATKLVLGLSQTTNPIVGTLIAVAGIMAGSLGIYLAVDKAVEKVRSTQEVQANDFNFADDEDSFIINID